MFGGHRPWWENENGPVPGVTSQECRPQRRTDPVSKHQTLSQGDDVANITTAHTSHSDEMRSRMIKYAVAMGIRMACLGLLFVVPGWWKVLPILGAVFIPWFAVIIANGGGDTSNPEENALLDHAPQAELESAEEVETAPEPVLLQGEIVPDGEAGEDDDPDPADETGQARPEPGDPQ